MKNAILEEYADIKRKIKELEDRKEEIEIEVIDQIDLYGEREIKTSYGVFSLSSRKTWKYSPKVDELKKSLYEVKKIEEKNGEAELVKDSQFVVFKPNKNE